MLGYPSYEEKVAYFKWMLKDLSYDYNKIFYGTALTISSSYSLLNKSSEADSSSSSDSDIHYI